MMNLERADLLQLVPLSHRGTLKLLPVGKKNKQKLLVGDDSGQIGCYEFKSGERQVVFLAKPFEGPVTCVELGGNPQKRDKIFVSHSQRIVGYTKKGKEFFKLTSTLTETIQNIAIEDTRIWTGCEYIHNLYDNGKETAYYNSLGQINHLFVSHLTRDNEFDTIISCQDKCIRLLHGSHLFVEIPLNYPVLCAAQLDLNKDLGIASTPVRSSYLVFGTTKGTLGIIQVSSTAEYQVLWEVEDGDKRSAINGIKIYDMNKDNVPEIVVGRDDGRVEIFKVIGENIQTEPSKIFSKDIGESIRSVECGIVCTPGFAEIVVAAYSGKIISFTTEPIRSRAVEDTYGRSIQTVNNENRIKTLRKEVDDLKKALDKEKDKLKKANINSSELASMKPPIDFPVNTSFDLDSSIAAYSLSIELQTPIDMIILRSPVVLDFLDTDIGNTVLSISTPHNTAALGSGSGSNPSSPKNGNGGNGSSNGSSKSSNNLISPEDSNGRFVAVWRCQTQQRRMNLLIRTNEGEYGDLHITIVAAVQPKAAKVIKYELKPLSLHSKIHDLNDRQLLRPRSSVRYTGTMSLSTIHEWVQALFPDVPPRLDEYIGNERYYFRNTFTGAITMCDFRSNEILIESESASTIAIAKETMTRFANYRRVNIQEYVTPNDGSVPSFLGLLRERLEYQISLARKMQLVDAIQEISMQDPNPTWLSEEYQSILQEQEVVRNAYKNRDRSLDYLSGIITDLYVDWNRIQGHDVKHKIPQLQQLIFTSDYQQILKFFNVK